MLAIRHGCGQLPAPVHTDLFGDEMVVPADAHLNGGPAEGSPLDRNNSPAGYEQAIIFAGGGELRGHLVSFDESGVVWQRPDFSKPCHFALSEISQLILNGADSWLESEYPEREEQRDPPVRATAQLVGGDWLSGEIVSPDGDSFSLDLDGAAFNFHRDQMQWLRFERYAAPEFTGWYGFDRGEERASQGLLHVPTDQGLSTLVPEEKNFDLSFEIAEGEDEGAVLFFTPFAGPRVILFESGEFMVLGKNKIRHSVPVQDVEKPEPEMVEMPVPAEAQAAGPVRYRLICERRAGKFMLYRNGILLGAWEASQPGKEGAPAKLEIRQVTLSGPGSCETVVDNRGFRFDPARPFHVHWIRLRPWDGAAPPAKDTDETSNDDRWTFDGASHIAAHPLANLSKTALTLEGNSRLLSAGLSITFPKAPLAAEPAGTRILLGRHGELSAGVLRIADGTAHFHTPYGGDATLPLASVSGVVLANGAGALRSSMLVFKNAEVCPGTLVAAESGKPWRWKTPAGGEIEIQSELIAGVHFRSGGSSPEEKRQALAELLMGDRIRGQIAGVSEKQVTIRHAALGELAIDTSQMLRLFPNPRGLPLDIPARSERASEQTPPETPLSFFPIFSTKPHLYFDGSLVTIGDTFEKSERFYRTRGGFYQADLPDLFEVSFDMTNGSGSLPSCSLWLVDKRTGSPAAVFGGEGDMVNFCFLEEHDSMITTSGDKNASVSEKLKKPSSRISVRIFVDGQQGKLWAFYDGMLLVASEASARLASVQRAVVFLPDFESHSCNLVSNVRITPWLGQLPDEKEHGIRAELMNGDIAEGKVLGLQDGAVAVETDAGPLRIPIANVRSVVFNDALSPVKAPARLRLYDGSVIHAESFAWDGKGWAFHSPVFGDRRLPAETVEELVLNPAPMRLPLPLASGKKK